jgi:hypothetical protein
MSALGTNLTQELGSADSTISTNLGMANVTVQTNADWHLRRRLTPIGRQLAARFARACLVAARKSD